MVSSCYIRCKTGSIEKAEDYAAVLSVWDHTEYAKLASQDVWVFVACCCTSSCIKNAWNSHNGVKAESCYYTREACLICWYPILWSLCKHAGISSFTFLLSSFFTTTDQSSTLIRTDGVLILPSLPASSFMHQHEVLWTRGSVPPFLAQIGAEKYSFCI